MHGKLRPTLLCCLLFLLGTVTALQAQELGDAEKLTREHIDKVLKEAPSFTERYGKSVAERAVKDAKGGQIRGMQAPIDHPWAEFGNPDSALAYFTDSMFNLDSREFNVTNWSQAWSCFEPMLLAKAHNGREVVNVAGPGNEDLIAECRNKCVWQEQIPFPRGSEIGALMYDAVGCGGDTEDPWGYLENGYEVVAFWYPEYQVEINNYGINRVRPELLSPTGQSFTRKSLIQQKQGVEKQIIKELESPGSYPLQTDDLKLPEDRSEPFIGQGAWGGYAATDTQDKAYGHVVRTWLSTSEDDKKIKTQDGWRVDPERSYLDAMPKRMDEHDPANIWTEYGLFDVITSIPHMSYRIRPDLMQALFGGQEAYSEKARSKSPFFQNQGAAAYRKGRWPDIYGPLERVGIESSTNATLKEAVYKGGYELFPLVTNMSGFTTPDLSTAAVFARRVLYLAGARSPVNEGGDASGSVQSAFPQGAEKGRIMTYTINSQDKSREIDKMQLISPRRPKDGTATGGTPPMVSECFRSQNIPNFINKDKSLQQWADRNMPRKLVGYHSDIDTFSAQGGAIVYTYWNRRIGCFCDRCGIPTGSSTTMNGGDGDKLYDKPRQEYCRYPLLPKMTAWSAWAKRDTFKECERNGKNQSFYDGRGLRDAS